MERVIASLFEPFQGLPLGALPPAVKLSPCLGSEEWSLFLNTTNPTKATTSPISCRILLLTLFSYFCAPRPSSYFASIPRPLFDLLQPRHDLSSPSH